MSNYRVLIPASGQGERLGEITKYTNKALVRVGRKPAISYIIESYPKQIEIVITLRHFGDQIKDFLELAYPERKFIFVEESSKPGNGKVFSMGRSMLAASKFLQCPFIIQCCDTLVLDQIPRPIENWNGVARGDAAAQFSTVTVMDGKIKHINPKGAIDYDFLHIGLVGVSDFDSFWKTLTRLYKTNPKDSSLNDCQIINAMVKNEISFSTKQFSSWYDTGNVQQLRRAKENIPDKFVNLDKMDENIYLLDNSVIKFFLDKKIVENRVKRGRQLKGLVPKLEGYNANFYKYKFVPGEVYSRTVNPNDFSFFLGWCDHHIWKRIREVGKEKFKKICHEFYQDKTLERINRFFETTETKDEPNIINGEKVPTVKEILQKVDFNWLSDATQFRFHGDLILDNILKTEMKINNGYCLLDWRQDFGGLLRAGDMYYDLAKLNHNLVVNHDIVNDGNFTIKIGEQSISCDILRKHNLVACQETLMQFLRENNYDVKKVKTLTPIIWLNMAPLHHHPFNLFLFYFGKLNLWRVLNENS